MFSPGVKEGRKPRRRPRDRSVWKNPLDPARVSHFSVNQCDTLSGSYTLYASSLPGVFGTSCLDTRAKSR